MTPKKKRTRKYTKLESEGAEFLVFGRLLLEKKMASRSTPITQAMTSYDAGAEEGCDFQVLEKLRDKING